ncbi:MAG: hypothetical protein DHS20C17_16780 [Cyclobacteriaceae bacterium]|nr:MAG: hypothetical protein DHS20C17_16780 [Cyclobacteriaceae bacterium]
MTSNVHTFHIPVMGIGFTVDTPLKISRYGVDSVIFISDDMLLEKMRKFFCTENNLSYEAITTKMTDFRAKRITSYLNLINILARQQFDALCDVTAEKYEEVIKYFDLLPDSGDLKKKFMLLIDDGFDWDIIRKWVKSNIRMGSINVNIMTKLDKDNYRDNEKLPIEFNDAHAALRGYANSDLNSSIVFSAGMNPRLFSYLESFEDFFPDVNGDIRKRIILKVSDFRSAMIQGKFLAKKGLWVSEFRVESGLNCGGHAFATDGYLMGPILAEFKEKRDELQQSLHEILVSALSTKGRVIPKEPLLLKITAQGGVGTAQEHKFLLDHYQVDSVGWGTPFLLVPEATSVDEATIEKLIAAREEDLYLSNISPLGVPFNNLRGNTKDLEKQSLIAKGRPGSSCPKKYLSFNTEFTEQPICTASRQYQHLKLNQLNNEELPAEVKRQKFEKIVENSCLCLGLSTAPLIINHVDHKTEGEGVLICPGPNMAYFSKKLSFKEMVDHIYGRTNVISRTDRPNMFIKELRLYISYLENKVQESELEMNMKRFKYLLDFLENLKSGIDYYSSLLRSSRTIFKEHRTCMLNELQAAHDALLLLNSKINRMCPA